MRLVADQGAQIARLTQTLRFNEMIIKELRHEVAEERAAVVAWLDRKATEWEGGAILSFAVDLIMNGEHRREEK